MAPATLKQALSALLFLYCEVARLFTALQGLMAQLGSLLYGTGLRLMEALRLRVKDVDFERREIVERAGHLWPNPVHDRQINLKPPAQTAAIEPPQSSSAHSARRHGLGLPGWHGKGGGSWPVGR